MNTSSNSTPPCLVLAVGAQAEQIALDAQTLYLRGNPWRSGTARFLSLRFSRAANAVQAICAPLKAARARKASAATRQQIYAATLHFAVELRAVLESALHDLRAHEQTLLAGLGEKRALPLQVLLLADLARPESAAIFPLMALLEGLLSHEADKQMLLLLNGSRFSEGKDARQQNACCHAGLCDLQALCAPQKNAFQERLAQDLELPGLAFPPSFSVFLFDRYKEGGWEVKDENELCILSANLLLAALTSGLAAQMEPFAYHSAGATALVYDPQNLIEACATRAGLEFIQREFGEEVLPDLHSMQLVIEELSAMYGDLRGWLKAITAGTGFKAHPGDVPGLETHFADLGFDDLPVDEWSYAIQGYDTHFGQAQFPPALEKLKANSQALAEKVSQEQADTLDTLPRQARLYPGGLVASRKIIAELRNLLRVRREQFAAWDAETFSQDKLSQRVEQALGRLDGAVAALPQPPRWFSLLPFSLGHLAKYVFALLYLRKEHARLVLLRQQAVYVLEAKYAAMLEKEAREALCELCQRLRAELEDADQAVQAFQGEVQRARTRLENRSGPEAGLSIFRPSGVDESVLTWACDEFKKPVEEIRFLLFEEHDFLYYWRDMDGRNLESGLLTFMQGMYQPLWTYNLDQILSHRADGDLTPLWTALSQGTMPLLRPDFDLAGSTGQTFQTQHFLCASTRNTAFAPFLRQPLAAWELLATGDPTLAMWVHVRHMIPLAALKPLLERGQSDFEKLSGDERGLRLFSTESEQLKSEPSETERRK